MVQQHRTATDKLRRNFQNANKKKTQPKIRGTELGGRFSRECHERKISSEEEQRKLTTASNEKEVV